ncbi:putative bifunctional diguanylate cyclase/phosphodiesterase [Parablautia muri]|uniref:GGDEF domain-containing protein n=1 Tax=Parablautia muri TaxID=2320879 RepID=A0A9X5GRA2_9FIRM|nr:bifunctional diguanylate cyclase/phosphodiesterase [Parablautia muri]NBJ92109.1 GGDEF domain-containing protein [Parablautia muri]
MDELRYQVDLLGAMNQKLTNDEKMYQMICDVSGSAFLYINFTENQVRILGDWNFFFPDVEVKDVKDLAKLYAKAEEKYVLPLRDLLFLEKSQRNTDGGIIRLKDEKAWVECTVSVLYDESGNATDKVIRFKDISKLKNQNDDLAYMAYYDMPTGLYNKNYFIRLLTDYVHRAEQENAIVSLISIDVSDNRKQRDGLKLSAGEEGTQQFGQFLSSIQGENVIVSYFQADIFCIAIYDPRGCRTVENICRQIQERMETPFELQSGQKSLLSAGIGIAEYPEAAKTALELINCAEIVVERAKKSGPNTVQYFDTAILDEIALNLHIENDLKEALSNLSFDLNFQPQYDTKEERLRGIEALVRWQRPDGMQVSPMDFIPIAEKNGTMSSIDGWVVEESIRTFAIWKKKFELNIILSLNISASQYMEDGFTDKLLGMIKKYGVNPEELELEITEGLLFEDYRTVTEKMCVLKDYGIRFALDDFGTGYSSLAYLKGLPVNTLKIDKELIEGIMTDQNTEILIESVITMAQKLGYEIIAEGVETKEQLSRLKELGCDYMQGYLLSRPMRKEDMEQLLK